MTMNKNDKMMIILFKVITIIHIENHTNDAIEKIIIIKTII